MKTMPASDLELAELIEVVYFTATDTWNGTGEYPAALYVLSFPFLVSDDRIWDHATIYYDEAWGDSDRRLTEAGEWSAGNAWIGELNITAMLDEGTWSTGERILIETASSLFNGDTKVNLGHLINRASDEWVRRAVEAIQIGAGLSTWHESDLSALRGMTTPAPGVSA